MSGLVELPLSTEALEALEAKAAAAVSRGAAGDLEILGYGEISIVLRCRTADGDFACKRLPPFDTEQEYDAYRDLLDEYLKQLEEAGTAPVPTAVRRLAAGDQGAGFPVYCVQPVLDPATLGPRLLAEAPIAEGLAFFGRVIDALRACIGPALGLDAQLSNWALSGDDLVYLDVATPLMRDEAGNERLDTALFAASLPWALRGPVRWWMLDDILGKYYDLRRAVVDLLGNLIKEGLGERIPSFAALANVRCGFDKPIGLREIERYYAGDARMWGALQALRRADRWWQRRVRRRDYPFLLPEGIVRHV